MSDGAMSGGEAAEPRPTTRRPSDGFFRVHVEATPLRLVVLGLLAFAFATIDIRAGIGPHDEGLMLQWGHRIASGEWPYRDFWANYMPGAPYLQALLGPSPVTWRWVRAAIAGICAVLAYLLTKRETTNDRWALAAWAAVAAAMAWPLTPGPTAPATTLALGAVLAGRRRSGLAGGLAGLAFLFRPEVGVAAAIGAYILGGREHGGRRVWWVFGAVALIGMLPFLIVAPGDFLSQTFGFAGLQHLQRLPFPLAPHTLDPNKVLEHDFPAVLVLFSALWAIATLSRRTAWALVPLLVVGLAYLLARTDEFHLVPLAAVLAVALAAGAARDRRVPWKVVLGAGLALIIVNGLDRELGKVTDGTRLAGVDLPALHGVRTAPDDAHALEELAAAVDRRTRPGSYLLSAPPRYDRVRVGDTLLYIALQRRNPTRYDVVQPGVVTTAKVQREMARDLERTRTPLVVRWLSPAATMTEHNGSGRSSGVHLLDDYIDTHYAPAGRFGDYLLLARDPGR
ncbi:MAG TPA: hypothetical protein VFG42_05220 [Baekduia sp.]|uniref:hypothetical protein n=1 Tax=Baekduia sp. TaxID=2600305 RepID=UPI002D7732FC|nr:hypothetical protein [Baekduia sp.]HET6506167.1 hypothetical protein [Baekduia sp.]